MSENNENNEKKKSTRIDVNATTSDLPGVAGFFEGLFRKIRGIGYSAALSPVFFMYVFCIGVSLMPGIYAYKYITSLTDNTHEVVQVLGLGLSIGLGYFLYVFSIILVVPALNKILFLNHFVTAWRGSWFSLRTLPWYYHNALVQLVRYSALDIITPTPLNILFYRLMGMKIGKGCQINTSNISDPCLITLDDYVTLGGSCTIFAHYAQAGFLILAPVHIKRRATVGLKASVMGDVIIDEKVTVKPHSVVLPKTHLKKGDKQ